VLLFVAVGPVSAHGVATRFDAPVPLASVYLGAGLTVAASATLIAFLDVTPHSGTRIGSVPVRVAVWARTAGRVGFLLAFVAVLLHGVVGPPTFTENLATLFTWSVWLKGVAIVAVIAGSPWAILSPWRTAYDAVCRLEGSEIRVRDYPERLRRWPAFAGFVVLVGVIENLTRVPQRPAATVAVVASYALVMFAGGLAFGRPWFDRADPLSVLYGLLGRVAPISVRRGDDGSATFLLRDPWWGCTSPVADRATVAFVVAMIYTVTFDGFAESPVYADLYFRTGELLAVGASTSLLMYAAGLAGFLAAFAGVSALTGLILQSGGNAPSSGSRAESDGGVTTPLLLAPTLLPIVAGYEVAHNLAYVLTTAGRLPRILGLDAVDPLWWLSIPAFWGLQVVCIVGGHVVAVVAADTVARRLAPTGRLAVAAHAPQVVLMICYTVVSLWVISLPVA
jgi:succinate dehydrogenase hydrophobic anchor subunit